MKVTKTELYEILKPTGSHMCLSAADRFEATFQGEKTAEAYNLYRRISHGSDLFWILGKLDYNEWQKESLEAMDRGTELCLPESSWEAVVCAELKRSFPWRRLKPALEKKLKGLRSLS